MAGSERLSSPQSNQNESLPEIRIGTTAIRKGEMTTKDELVTAIIHVRQSWVQTTGASTIFASSNVTLGSGDILAIPVTRWDISDDYFVEFTFYPRALEKESVKSIKVLAPKQEVVLIVELKRPEAMPALGYRRETNN
jgi:hypothetical protein